ncbi:PLD nuclease N-terminal domain-containing protein [Nesterenkonia sp. F]|uniref:PLD nuclease N-terminal domain-containing protein n=1 Tax=Nesterenkonia sp. F TaxID=795955 RepID=UPI000255CB08|nr:PLD nuclease N-terminal domain-containing protein [Nesterenkonia sp. F]
MRLIIPLGIVGLGLVIYSLIECVQTPRHRLRVMGKAAWLAVIVLVPVIGAGLWLGFGRRRGDAGAGPTAPKGAPDDDPNFLRTLEVQRRQRQREEELRRKEQELEARERRKKPDADRGDADGGSPGGTDATDSSAGTNDSGSTDGSSDDADGTDDADDTPDAPGSDAPDQPR